MQCPGGTEIGPHGPGRILTVARNGDSGLQGLSDWGEGGGLQGRNTGVPERGPLPLERSDHVHQREQQGPGRGAWETTPHRSAFKNKPLMGHPQRLSQDMTVSQ